MTGIRFRIVRCDDVNNDQFVLIKNVCISVEREDNVGSQISHCIQLTGSQCIGKSNRECIDLAFNSMSSSIVISANKLLSSETDFIGGYYIPQ